MATIVLLIVVLLTFQILSCREMCPPLPNLEWGNYVKVSEKVVRVECHPSYEYYHPKYPTGDVQVVTCRRGKWDDPHPKCLAKPLHCLPPGNIDNGYIFRGDPPYAPDSEVLYRCYDGYKLVGPEKITCKYPHYVWSDQLPECIEKLLPMVQLAEDLEKHLVDRLDQFDAGRVIDHNVEFHGLDLFLVFDKSSSIDSSDFLEGIKFAKFLIEHFKVANGDINKVGGTRLAVHTFGDKQKQELSLDDESISSTEAALEKLDTIKCGDFCEGGTNMADVLKSINFIAEKGLRKQAKKVLFLTSDGSPTSDPSIPKPVTYYMDELKKKGFEIYIVGIGQDINFQLLVSLSSTPPSEHLFLLEEFRDFSDVMDLIRNGTAEPPPPPPYKCGYIANRFYKIRELGKNGLVKLGSWPWLAAVVVRDYASSGSRFACSGVLICQNWVLTTAQCVTDIKGEQFNPADVYVILSEDNLEKSNSREQNFYAVEIIRHKQFVNDNKMIRNDLALIKLNEKAEINDYSRIACILDNAHDFSSRAGETAYMIGWLVKTGEQARLTVEPVREFNAQQVQLEINGMDVCEANKPDKYKCDDYHLLSGNAGHEPSEKCKGIDMGSPLLMADSTGRRMSVVGVATYVEGCTLDTKLAFFTRVSAYYDWIREATGFCTDDYE
uniref:C3/C5 convertase n=1 Tax=Hemiscolopendra marginata TaxID=943146 RepID=A0A646QGK0_9MYRI